MSRTYGDPSRRPEVREATIEFIAPQEYMLRPPQPATYLWVLDVTRQAVDTGYLKVRHCVGNTYQSIVSNCISLVQQKEKKIQ